MTRFWTSHRVYSNPMYILSYLRCEYRGWVVIRNKNRPWLFSGRFLGFHKQRSQKNSTDPILVFYPWFSKISVRDDISSRFIISGFLWFSDSERIQKTHITLVKYIPQVLPASLKWKSEAAGWFAVVCGVDLLWNFVCVRERERDTHTHTFTSDTIIEEEQSGELKQRVARKQQNNFHDIISSLRQFEICWVGCLLLL